MRPIRYLLLLCLAVASLLVGAFLSGCLLGRGVAPLTESDDGSTIAPPPGAVVTVSLESNKTTGFSWVVADPGPTRQLGQPEYEEPSSQATGAPGRETFKFKADESGNGELKLEYRRPWESKDIPAEKTWSVTIEVQ